MAQTTLEAMVPTANRRATSLATAGRLLAHALLLVGGVAMVLPFLWTIGNSLKPSGEIFTWPPTLWPATPQPFNYVDLFIQVPFVAWARNSLIITGLATLGSVLSSTLAGYAFSRLRYPGRDVFFTICLSTMMLPSIVTLIPSFILYRNLGWIDTFLPLIVPSWLGTPFYIFLARQYFRTIPREYEEAARVDGAGSWHIWWTLMLPMSRTLISAIVIFSFIAHWNEFLGPLIYLNSVENLPLAVGLRSLQNFYNTRWDLIMAGAVLMTLPMVTLFFLAQRYFIEGMSSFSGLGSR